MSQYEEYSENDESHQNSNMKIVPKYSQDLRLENPKIAYAHKMEATNVLSKEIFHQNLKFDFSYDF